jgi:paraquat-inducible protein B
MSRTRLLNPVLALCTLLLLGARAIAQEEVPVEESPQPPSKNSEVSLNIIDQKLALSLAVDMHCEIDRTSGALKVATTPAVRQYLTQRLAVQQALADQLDQLTGGRAKTTIARAAKEIEHERNQERTPRTRFRPMAIQNATAAVARIRLEMQQEYAAMVRAELNAQPAAEFDRHFLRAEVLHQMQVVATLRVFEGQASEDFAKVIAEAGVVAGEELAAAKKLLQQVESTPAVVALPAAAAPKAQFADTKGMP